MVVDDSNVFVGDGTILVPAARTDDISGRSVVVRDNSTHDEDRCVDTGANAQQQQQ
jgi:hypothetical protein